MANKYIVNMSDLWHKDLRFAIAERVSRDVHKDIWMLWKDFEDEAVNFSPFSQAESSRGDTCPDRRDPAYFDKYGEIPGGDFLVKNPIEVFEVDGLTFVKIPYSGKEWWASAKKKK